MTAPDLSAIRAQLASITKLGEWETRGNAVVIYDPNGYGAYCLIATTDTKEDAAFIAAAPSTVTRLLGIVERVEAVLDAIETHSSLDSSPVEYRTLDGWVDVEDALRTALTGEGA